MRTLRLTQKDWSQTLDWAELEVGLEPLSPETLGSPCRPTRGSSGTDSPWKDFIVLPTHRPGRQETPGLTNSLHWR